MIWRLRILLLFFSLALASSLQAQESERQKLEAQKIKLLDEIELANRILEETQKDKANSLGTIETVQQKLKLRGRLIRTLDREIELLNEEEADLRESTDTLRVRIETLKASYAVMIKQAYKSRKNISRLMFILSSDDFNQALRRIEYLKQYSAYRERQVREIEKKEKELAKEMDKLRVQKVRKNAVRIQLNLEKKKLSDERLSQEGAILAFQEMEENLNNSLKEKQIEAQKVEKEIGRIIAAEIARVKAAAVRNQLEDRAIEIGLIRGKDFSSNTTNSSIKEIIARKEAALKAANIKVAAAAPNYELTPEARLLSSNFEANRKRLPWPVERGLVVGNFGPQRHPVVKSVIIDNRGIDIATEKNTAIRAIFDGEVIKMFRMPTGQLALIINHGTYFSVYQNLTEITVNKGDKVTKMQSLGKSYTNPINSETKLHFEIWSNQNAVNPLLWLSAK
jgi:septal ring factor EnvC (AmiA/AmiB activator)